MKQEPQKTRLEMARLKQAELRARGELVRLNPIDKAKANPTSLRLAITAKCYDCEGQDADPGVRQRIGTCGIKTCPLWPVRPWQRLAAGEDDDE